MIEITHEDWRRVTRVGVHAGTESATGTGSINLRVFAL